ncbi:MAG: hypothetical protein WCO84_01275 [bacterium]
MSRYLQKYVGTYRVLAEYDQSTNDFPRDETGQIDSTFEDLYIPCQKGIRIMHYDQGVLWLYIPKKKKGAKLSEDYLKTLGLVYKKVQQEPEYTLKGKPKKPKFEEELVLENKMLILSLQETDGEVILTFKATSIEDIAKLVKPKTSGANVSPFSKKNLPKAKYTIPKKDLDKYKQITVKITKDNMILMAKIFKDFETIIQKEKGKKFSVVEEKKKSMLKNKEFIHSVGMWNQFLDFTEKRLVEI